MSFSNFHIVPGEYLFSCSILSFCSKHFLFPCFGCYFGWVNSVFATFSFSRASRVWYDALVFTRRSQFPHYDILKFSHTSLILLGDRLSFSRVFDVLVFKTFFAFRSAKHCFGCEYSILSLKYGHASFSCFLYFLFFVF
jgi:hypothetical protein